MAVIRRSQRECLNARDYINSLPDSYNLDKLNQIYLRNGGREFDEEKDFRDFRNYSNIGEYVPGCENNN